MDEMKDKIIQKEELNPKLEDIYNKVMMGEITLEEFIDLLTALIMEVITGEEILEAENKEEMSAKRKKDEEDNQEDKDKKDEEEQDEDVKEQEMHFNIDKKTVKWFKIYDIKDYYHAKTGEKISKEDLQEAVENFQYLHFKYIPLNIEHNELEVIGKVYDLKIENNKLYALIETDKKNLEKFKYFSIEIEELKNIHTGEKIGKVITGIALTNKPALNSYTTSIKAGLLPKELALAFSRNPKYLSLLNKIMLDKNLNKKQTNDDFNNYLIKEFQRRYGKKLGGE
ncbi:MAG: hypothetical protein ACPL1F_00135 [bacterium]